MIATEKKPDPTDLRILELWQQGLINKEIARELNLKKKTIDNRLHEMRKYYKCSTTKQLINKVKGINTLSQQ